MKHFLPIRDWSQPSQSFQSIFGLEGKNLKPQTKHTHPKRKTHQLPQFAVLWEIPIGSFEKIPQPHKCEAEWTGVLKIYTGWHWSASLHQDFNKNTPCWSQETKHLFLLSLCTWHTFSHQRRVLDSSSPRTRKGPGLECQKENRREDRRTWHKIIIINNNHHHQCNNDKLWERSL